MRGDHKEVLVAALPKCDFCTERAGYDFRTRKGQWAFACEAHYHEFRAFTRLGLGMGQRLIVKGETS